MATQMQARVVALDMPGFGLTERPGGLGVGGFDALQVVKGVIQELGIGGKWRQRLVMQLASTLVQGRTLQCTYSRGLA